MPGELRARSVVGRAAEQQVLHAALSALSGGRGGVVLLSGEAGVGKSRLLRDVADRAGAGSTLVLSGRAVPNGAPLRPLAEALLSRWRGRPFPDRASMAPYRHALARLVPGWSDGPARQVGPESVIVLAEALLELLGTAAPTGTLLLLEDLHSADPETIGVIDHLAGGVGGIPLLLVGSIRTGEPGTAAALDLRRRADVTVIGLRRLTDDDATALAAECLPRVELPDDVLAHVAARSAGLPLLVEELLTGLVEGGALHEVDGRWVLDDRLAAVVPDRLRELVASRLDRLGGAPRAVLQIAAVAGDPVDWRLIAASAGLPEPDVLAGLRAAVDSNLLTTADAAARGQLRWRHELTRSAVLDLLHPPELARIAGLVADRLELDPSVDGGRIAALRVQAGQPDRAARRYLDLAAAFAASGELGAAGDMIDSAATLAPETEIAVIRTRVLTLSGRAADALRTGEGLLDRVAGEPHAQLCLELAGAAVVTADWSLALNLVQRSGRSGLPVADAIAADACFGAGDVAGARALSHRVIEHPDAPPDAVCAALEVLGRCAGTTDPAEADACYRRAAQTAAEHGLTAARVSALHAMGSMELSRTGRSAALGEARRVGHDAGMLSTVASIDVLRADMALLESGPAASAQVAGGAAALCGRLGLSGLGATATLLEALALACGDRAAEARQRLVEIADRFDGNLDLAGGAKAVAAIPRLLSGDVEGARDHLDAGIALLARNPSGAPLTFWGLWVVVRSVLADRDDQARAELRASPAGFRSANLGALRYAEAIAAGRSGAGEAAVGLMAEADDLLAHQHWWRRFLRLLTWRAAVTDGWGAPVRGLRADLAVFESAREDSLARICRDLLRAAGVTVRRGSTDTAVPPELRAVGITARETEVLALVAQGLSNAEVAGRLFLSTRTVEHHVARLLAKTGSGGRVELTRFAVKDNA